MEKLIICILFTIETILCAPYNFDSDYIPNQRVIDINNPDQDAMASFNDLNVNLTVIREQQLKLKNKHKDQNPNSSSEPLSSDQAINNFSQIPSAITRNDPTINNPENILKRKEYESLAMEAIRNILESSIMRNNSNHHLPILAPNDITHYTAVHPMCELPKFINESVFFSSQSNTWNIYFAPPNSDNVHSAILRLYKIAQEDGHQHSNNGTDCSQQEDLIRITVSYYVKRRDKRKRMCSSVMVARYLVGWVEFDVVAAVKFWNRLTNSNTKKNFGIAIDIQDQDETPLKASDYFNGYTCEASSTLSIPWTVYKEPNSLSSDYSNGLPRFPRIDYEMRGTPYHHVKSTQRYENNIFSGHYGYGYQSDSPAQSTTSYTEQNNSDDEEKHNRSSQQHNHHRHHRHHHNHQNLNSNSNNEHNHQHNRHQNCKSREECNSNNNNRNLNTDSINSTSHIIL